MTFAQSPSKRGDDNQIRHFHLWASHATLLTLISKFRLLTVNTQFLSSEVQPQKGYRPNFPTLYPMRFEIFTAMNIKITVFRVTIGLSHRHQVIIMGVASSSETSVPIHDTTRNIPAQVLPSLCGTSGRKTSWHRLGIFRAASFCHPPLLPSLPPSVTNAVCLINFHFQFLLFMPQAASLYKGLTTLSGTEITQHIIPWMVNRLNCGRRQSWPISRYISDTNLEIFWNLM
jgi:hypothetical protein